MEALITSQGGILAAIALIVAISFMLQRVNGFKTFGPALPCIIIGIILSNLNVLPHWDNIYATFFNYAVPLGLTMFLLNVNLKEFMKVSKQPLLAMLLAVISVSVVTIIAGFIFAPHIDQGWKVAGMFVGTYTGGSSNLTAIGTGLNATPTLFASANAADYATGIPITLIFFMVPGFIAKSKKFKELWPYSLTKEELDTEDDGGLFEKKDWSIIDIAVLFALGFIVTELSTVLSRGFDPMLASAVRIILVTTFAIGLAQVKQIRNIEGNMDLGFYLALTFLTIIGLSIDIKQFMGSAPLITLYCAIVIIGTLIVHITLCRIFKIKYQYVIISIVAAIADGSNAALVAGTGKWKSIMSIAVVLGSLGMAIGNYVGIGIAYLVKAMIGA